MKRVLLRILPVVDLVLSPFTLIAALLLGLVRRVGVHRLPLSRSALFQAGVFPVRNHYYEPQFDFRDVPEVGRGVRPLPGIDWNEQGQTEVLRALTFGAELADLAGPDPGDGGFRLGNSNFESGDAEYWYQLIRWKKPRRIFEIGSGHSTRLAIRAIKRNQMDDPGYTCRHVCVEPYEMPWLEESGLEVVRQKVESLGTGFFGELGVDDILFIDSSHVIRAQGDVLFEYLQLLPVLRPGVIVHVHDIFSPADYPREWIVDEVRFWNEQYLLEAFLSHNAHWKILGALAWLTRNHRAELQHVAPHLTPDRLPGSFYMQRLDP